MHRLELQHYKIIICCANHLTNHLAKWTGSGTVDDYFLYYKRGVRRNAQLTKNSNIFFINKMKSVYNKIVRVQSTNNTNLEKYLKV